MSSNQPTSIHKKQAVIVQCNKIEPDDSASLLGETIEMDSLTDQVNQFWKQRNNDMIPSLTKASQLVNQSRGLGKKEESKNYRNTK